MQTIELQNRLTSGHHGDTVPATPHGARRPDSSSEFVRMRPTLLATRVACRQRPMLRNGACMFSQSVSSRVRTIVFSCAAALGLLLTGKAAAQDSAPGLLTLDEAIRIAVANNRTLRI